MVIDHNGEKLGSMSLGDALALSQKENLDLVQVSPPDSNEAVCKIMDYGKYVFGKKNMHRAQKQK